MDNSANEPAGIQGIIDNMKYWREAKYNPAHNDTFVDAETGDAVYKAEHVVMISTKVYYIP